MPDNDYQDALALSILEYAAQVLGGTELGRAWLEKHNPALGGIPNLIAATPVGELRVRSVLLKIEHGLSV